MVGGRFGGERSGESCVGGEARDERESCVGGEGERESCVRREPGRSALCNGRASNVCHAPGVRRPRDHTCLQGEALVLLAHSSTNRDNPNGCKAKTKVMTKRSAKKALARRSRCGGRGYVPMDFPEEQRVVGAEWTIARESNYLPDPTQPC